MGRKQASFPFVVLNDLHYTEEACRPWLEGLVRRVNALAGGELVLVLGDLSETGTREELLAAREILRQLKMPWYPVPGNHDGPPDRPVGSGAEGLEVYEELFPNRRNYSFEHRGWQFLGLDTTNGSGYQQLPVTEETKAFAAHAAATLSRSKPTILFTHVPLDPTVRFSLSDGYALLELLRPLNLRIVFSGHYHGLSENLAPGWPHLRLLTNRCCARKRELHDGSSIRGYFECVAKEDEEVDYRFVEYAGDGAACAEPQENSSASGEFTGRISP